MGWWGDVKKEVGATARAFANPFRKGAWRHLMGLDAAQIFLPMPEFPALPDATARTPSVQFPRSGRALGQPRPLLWGRPHLAGQLLYEAADLEHVDAFVGAGLGPLESLSPLYVDGVEVSQLAGARAAYYLGTWTQNADARSANLRHLDPSGAPVALTVWDSDDHGWAPAAGTRYATAAFTVQSELATVRVHVQGSIATSAFWKVLRFKVWHRPSGGGWTDAGLYELVGGPENQGVCEAYAVVQGGAVTTENPANFHYDAGRTPVALDTAKPASHREVFAVADALGFTAGDYELKVEFVSAKTYYEGEGGIAFTAETGNQGTLRFYALEVEERNDALALRGLAYAVATIPKGQSDRQRSYTFVPSGPKIQDWDGAAWVSRWSNNPIAVAAAYATHYAGMGLASGQVDWDFLAAEAAYCDVTVADLTDALTVSSYGTVDGWPRVTVSDSPAPLAGDYGGYKLRNQAGEERAIVRQVGQVFYLTAAFAAAPTSVTVREQRFRLDPALLQLKDRGDHLQELLDHCRGRWWETPGGKLRMAVERPRAVAKVLTVDHLVAGTFRAWQADETDLPAAVTAKYRDQADGWEPAAVTAGEPRNAQEDGWELPYLFGTGQAKRLAWWRYHANRKEWRCEVETTLAAIELEPCDVVKLKHPRMGWGYDITDPNAPVELADDHASVKSWVVEDVSDGAEDVRGLWLREYDAAIYADAPAILDPAPGAIPYPDPWAVPAAPENVTLSFLGDYTDDGLWNPEVQVEWTHPNPAGVAGYEVYESRDAGATWRLLAARDHAAPYRWSVVGFVGELQVALQAVGETGLRSAWPSASTVRVEAPGTLPANVGGLELFGQGNGEEFTGRDARFSWNRVGLAVSVPAGEEPYGAGQPPPETWFKDYEVTVSRTDGTRLRTEYVKDERYTYNWEKNYADTGGAPVRSFAVAVVARDRWNRTSARAARLTVANPAPGLPTAVSLTAGVRQFTVGFKPPIDPDVDHYLVYASESEGFTPAEANLLHRGQSTQVTKHLSGGGTWYVRLAAVDTFGEDTVNLSPEYSLVVPTLQVVADELYTTLRVDFLVLDSLFFFNAATLEWTLGAVQRAGTTYTLAAGTLANANAKYVIATLAAGTASLSLAAIAAGIPALASNQVIIAQTSAAANGAGNYLCFVRQANSMLLEGAVIRDATITNAHVESLDGAKLHADSEITLGVNGRLKTVGKDSSSDATAGVFLGYDTDGYKFAVGDGTKNIRWDGSELTIAGVPVLTVEQGTARTTEDLTYYIDTGGGEDFEEVADALAALPKIIDHRVQLLCYPGAYAMVALSGFSGTGSIEISHVGGGGNTGDVTFPFVAVWGNTCHVVLGGSEVFFEAGVSGGALGSGGKAVWIGENPGPVTLDTAVFREQSGFVGTTYGLYVNGPAAVNVKNCADPGGGAGTAVDNGIVCDGGIVLRDSGSAFGVTPRTIYNGGIITSGVND